jgi:CBS-domain-containing membrane protein
VAFSQALFVFFAVVASPLANGESIFCSASVSRLVFVFCDSDFFFFGG